MNKEEFLKAIMELPKAETINPISAMNSINIDDLMSVIDRLNKTPTYDELLKENKKLKMINEEYERLNKENYRGFKIINVQEYDIYELLSYKNNWNKLKEYINKMHEYFLYTDVNEIYKQSMKLDNQIPHLFNLSELNASDRILSSIYKKIQKLEQGSDSDE
jgi:hypothetical protein